LKPRSKILIIAGSDSSGGAGIQADIKTVTSLGSYAMTAITAVTAQNTTGVASIVSINSKNISKQIEFTCKDIKPDAIKIGMLHSSNVIKSVISSLNKIGIKKIILDPVMVAKGGHKLLKNEAINALKLFITKCNPILTPNIPEAEILTGMKIKNICDMEKAGKKILTMGASHVLLKGGHIYGDVVTDILVGENYCYSKKSKKIKTKHTHGTGCTMSSVLATSLAQLLEIKEAFEKAHDYVQMAIKSAPCLGHGNGPINHCHSINHN